MDGQDRTGGMEGWDQVLNECGKATSGIGGGGKGQEKAKKGSARIPCGQGGKAKLGRDLGQVK